MAYIMNTYQSQVLTQIKQCNIQEPIDTTEVESGVQQD
jgi:hypothetical protein